MAKKMRREDFTPGEWKKRKRLLHRIRYARWYAKNVKPITEARKAAKVPLTQEEIRARGRAYAKKWREENPERWKEICRDASAKANKKHPRKRKKQQTAATRRYQKRHRQKIAARAKAAYRSSEQHAKAVAKAKYHATPEYKEIQAERARKRATEWAKKNPDKCNARAAKRRALKIKATPGWANPEAIEKIYRKAQAMTRKTGIRHAVDHYWPLVHKDFVGLHVESNLRVITQSENSRKHNTAPAQ